MEIGTHSGKSTEHNWDLWGWVENIVTNIQTIIVILQFWFGFGVIECWMVSAVCGTQAMTLFHFSNKSLPLPLIRIGYDWFTTFIPPIAAAISRFVLLFACNKLHCINITGTFVWIDIFFNNKIQKFKCNFQFFFFWK